jgi:hypothetical protein
LGVPDLIDAAFELRNGEGLLRSSLQINRSLFLQKQRVITNNFFRRQEFFFKDW